MNDLLLGIEMCKKALINNPYDSSIREQINELTAELEQLENAYLKGVA